MPHQDEEVAYLVLLDRHIDEAKAVTSRLRHELATVEMDENTRLRKREFFMLQLEGLMAVETHRAEVASSLNRK